MKENKLSIKAIVSLVWLVIGVVAVFVGIFLNVPDSATQFKSFMITSDASLAQILFQTSSYTALIVLKYILIASGIIVAAIASIGFAGAIQMSKLEEVIYNDDLYFEEDEEGCNFDCSSCTADCGGAEETIEEVQETEEITEETVESTEE